MANKKISQLTNGNPAQANDIIPIDRSGTNFGVTAQSIADLNAGPSSSSQVVFALPGAAPSGSGGFTPSSLAFTGSAATAFVYFTGRALFGAPTTGKITFNVSSSSWHIDAINIAKVDQTTWNVVQSVPISFGSSFTPTLVSGVNESDSFSMTFDPGFDYIIRIYNVTGANVVFLQNSGTSGMSGGTYLTMSGDHSADSAVFLTGGNTYSGQSILTKFVDS